MEKVLGKDEFELGKAYIREGNYKEAAHYFRKALLYYKDNPNQTPGVLLSGYGVATALGEKNLKEGILFCKKSLNRKDLAPDYYLNLSDLYLRNRQKKEAYRVLEEGLKKFKNHPRILVKIKEFGVRKRPPIPLLGRSHPVNKVLGKILREPISNKK